MEMAQRTGKGSERVVLPPEFELKKEGFDGGKNI